MIIWAFWLFIYSVQILPSKPTAMYIAELLWPWWGPHIGPRFMLIQTVEWLFQSSFLLPAIQFLDSDPGSIFETKNGGEKLLVDSIWHFPEQVILETLELPQAMLLQRYHLLQKQLKKKNDIYKKVRIYSYNSSNWQSYFYNRLLITLNNHV